MSELKAKKRYEITKEKRNFDVKRIEPKEYDEELYNIQIEAFRAYPEKYRIDISWNTFLDSLRWQANAIVYGDFEREGGKLVGYALVRLYDTYASFESLKVIPMQERKGINVALVAAICETFEEKLREEHFYILDGGHASFHETNF